MCSGDLLHSPAPLTNNTVEVRGMVSRQMLNVLIITKFKQIIMPGISGPAHKACDFKKDFFFYQEDEVICLDVNHCSHPMLEFIKSTMSLKRK